MNKKLLFITYWFPPFQVIGAQRASSFVKYLDKEGWEIAVVTIKDHKWAFNGRRSSNSSVAGEKVYRLKGLNVAESLKRLSGGRLKGAGQSISSTGSSKKTLKSRAYSFYNNVISFPDECFYWYSFNKGKIAKIAKEFQPDVIFSSALPASSHLLAAKAQIACGVPWVAEYRDLWSGNPLKGRTEKSEAKHRKLELETMSNASHLITVSKPLAKELKDLHNKPADVIYNGFDPNEFTLKERPRNNKFTLVYTGMVYPQMQHPEIFFKALAKMKENGLTECDLVFRYYGPNKAMMVNLANEFDVAGFCELNDSIDRKTALIEQQLADLLLFFTFDSEGCLSGKVFEYLGASRNVLIVGRKEPELEDIIIKNKAGIHCSEADEVVRELHELLAQYSENSLSYDGLDSRSSYTREAMALKLSDILKETLKSKL